MTRNTTYGLLVGVVLCALLCGMQRSVLSTARAAGSNSSPPFDAEHLAAPAPVLLTLRVTSTVDAVDDAPGDGLCRTSVNQACTLRAAIQEANALPGLQQIRLPGGTYTLTLLGAQENDAATGDLDITDALRITGAGSAHSIIDGGRLDRVLHIVPGVAAPEPLPVTLEGLTMQHGYRRNRPIGVQTAGGGVLVEAGASVSIRQCVIAHNRSDILGGGLFTLGIVSLWRTTVSDNTATLSGRGGGIAMQGEQARVRLLETTIQDNIANSGAGIFKSTQGVGATLWIDRSTISGNTAVNFGGGILNDRGGTVTIRNSTLSGNRAGGGGAIGNDGGSVVKLYHSTVTRNTAAQAGGIADVHLEPRFIQLRGTIFAGNRASFRGPNCVGEIMSRRHNLLGDMQDCVVTPDATDIVNVTPRLSALTNNGGPTLTHALLPGSPAIDAVSDPSCPHTDQRGVTRPIDGNGDQQARCDIGAYEFIP